MHIAKLDLKHGTTLIDSEPIKVDENGALVTSIEKLCAPRRALNSEKIRYHFLKKISICGKSADGVIEIEKKEISSITFLFDFIEFFESSILESKIIKACEKSWNLKFSSIHPSTAFLAPCKWGQAVFFYDAKQGDLSLEIKFQHHKINLAED
jgi:hypothetical protein